MFGIKFLLLFAVPFCFFSNDGNLLQQKAVQQQKNIAVYFSGSDWCSSCHKFKSTVLSQPSVDSVLHVGYVFYEADFPQRKKLADSTQHINDFLAEKLNPGGVFPALIITDENFIIKYSQYGSKATIENVLANLKQHTK